MGGEGLAGAFERVNGSGGAPEPTSAHHTVRQQQRVSRILVRSFGSCKVHWELQCPLGAAMPTGSCNAHCSFGSCKAHLGAASAGKSG
jgi:hypothetical protein